MCASESVKNRYSFKCTQNYLDNNVISVAYIWAVIILDLSTIIYKLSDIKSRKNKFYFLVFE